MNETRLQNIAGYPVLTRRAGDRTIAMAFSHEEQLFKLFAANSGADIGAMAVRRWGYCVPGKIPTLYPPFRSAALTITSCCNMDCPYCFVYPVPNKAHMSPEFAKAAVRALAEYMTPKRQQIYLWGGEPTQNLPALLTALDAISGVFGMTCVATLTTNGYMEPEVLQTLSRFDFLEYQISYDGSAQDAQKTIAEGSSRRVLGSIRAASESGKSPIVRITVTNLNLGGLRSVFTQLIEEGLTNRICVEPVHAYVGRSRRQHDAQPDAEAYVSELLACIEYAEERGCRVYSQPLRPLTSNRAYDWGFVNILPDGTAVSTVAVIDSSHPRADIYAELESVAAEIARLTREKNYRYRDIGLVMREPSAYARAVEAAFEAREIPYFMSVPEDVENSPLAAGLTAALNAARGFEASPVLLFAKSAILNLTAEEAARLENYCYCWDIRGALWQTDFTRNPRGLSRMDDADAESLKRINEVRTRVVSPLLRLREAIKDADGRVFATAVYALLTEINAAENLTAFVKAFDEGQDALNEAARLWDAVMQILDIFGTALASRKMPSARFCELFRLALSAAGTASAPETLDQVLVGGADRIRPEKLRAVFVVGANEGVFPAPCTDSGVFSEPERRELRDAGLELSAGGLEQAALEKYFAYFALTLPSERLCVSWPRSSLKGRETLPSEIVLQLKTMFPGLPCPPADPLGGISGASSAFETLARGFTRNDALTDVLREYFGGPAAGEIYSFALSRMALAAEKPARRIDDKLVAKELFGSFMRLSPSRVEQYYRCPFSYFARYGLNIKKRGKVRFSGLEYGSAAHHVLEVMLRLYGGKGLCALTDKQILEEVAKIIREYLASVAGDEEMLSERFRFLYGRLCSTLTRLIRRLAAEFAQSAFEPCALEMPVKLGGAVEPVRFETESGVSVVVEGVVDRVDVMNKNGRRFVRVVDYKSGAKDFRLGDVLYGLNLQMLLYLFAIAENGQADLSGATPAGVLYMPSRESYLSVGREISGEDAKKELARQWRMNGLLLDDEEALRGMERELAGLFIPARAGKDGKPDASSQIAGAAEFARLGRKAERLVADMARLLSDGKIDALPVLEDGGAQCEHCDYGAVCGFEPGDAAVNVKKFGKQEFFKLLAEEEADA